MISSEPLTTKSKIIYPQMSQGVSVFLTAALIFASTLVGCKSETETKTIEKKPRPVEVQRLAKTEPPHASLVSASVASWKTEEIGMEVTGRIEWVVEPNTDIEGRVVGRDGTVIVEGTPIARIDDERYRLQVDNAKAQMERAKQVIKGAESELNSSLPAQMRAAEAEKKVALTEFERSKRLFQQNAGSQSDVDRDEARYQSAVSAIEQLASNTKAKEADLESLKLQLLQNEKSLRDAERSVEDCTLYSSFRGQISSVSVVPGSVLSPGQSVATIQMMDPIKVELEVSPEDSRRLRNRQRLPVLVTKEDGTLKEEDGFLYLVDSVADPLTRTFTITLLVINIKIDSGLKDTDNIAITDQMWRLDIPFIPGADKNKNYVGEKAILTDDQGPYLWKIENVKMSEPLPADQKLKVSKVRVELGSEQLPFLGNWVFQEVKILDPNFDPKRELVSGQISVLHGETNEWDGDTILVQNSGQWMLRPGDLVKVDLTGAAVEPGIFVPMDAISYSNEKTYLFLLNEDAPNATVSRVEVSLQDAGEISTTSSLLRVNPVGDAVALEGRSFVTRGVHYLRDGESVKVVANEDQK